MLRLSPSTLQPTGTSRTELEHRVVIYLLRQRTSSFAAYLLPRVGASAERFGASLKSPLSSLFFALQLCQGHEELTQHNY